AGHRVRDPPAHRWGRGRRRGAPGPAGRGGPRPPRAGGGRAPPAPRPGGAAPRPAAPPPPAPGGPAAGEIGGLTPEVTPNRLHYTVDESIIDPNVDRGSWRLRGGGLVGRPFSFGYDELVAMPSTEQYVTLQCISNLVGGDLVGTAKWTGVPLARGLERAGGARARRGPGGLPRRRRLLGLAAGGQGAGADHGGRLRHERPQPAPGPRVPGPDHGPRGPRHEERQVAGAHRGGRLRLPGLLAALRRLGQHRRDQDGQPHRRPPGADLGRAGRGGGG